MSWDTKFTDDFKDLASEFWPSAKVSPGLVSVYREVLDRFPPALVIKATRALAAEKDRLPRAGVIAAKCSELGGKGGSGKSARAEIIGRLSELVESGKNWYLDFDQRLWVIHEDGFRSSKFMETSRFFEDGTESERFESLWGLSIGQLDQIEAAVKDQETAGARG